MKTITVKEHINTGHKAYAIYDNERSIAHLADGLKISHRKILFTALQTLKKGEVIKVAALGNRASDLTDYSHGDDSITESVITMARSYPGSNNWPLLQGQGQFGNMVDNDSSEARYIHVLRHENLGKVILEKDDKVLIRQYSEGKSIDPKFYLPVLPIVLLNNSRGTGNGYANRILPRNPEYVALATKAVIRGEPLDPKWLMPYFPGFKGTVEYRDGSPTKYEIRGVVEEIPKTKTSVRITHLPPSSDFQYENYKDRVLLKLLDKKKIKSFESDSRENVWDIQINATREFTASKDLVAQLGLVWKTYETLTLWGWDGKLHAYSSAEFLLRDWVQGRLVFMESRRQQLMLDLAVEVAWLTAKVRFLKIWNEQHGELVKMSKGKIRETLLPLMQDITGFDEAMFNRLMQLSVSSLTHTEIDELLNAINSANDEIQRLKNTTPGDMLIADIDAIKFYK